MVDAQMWLLLRQLLSKLLQQQLLSLSLLLLLMNFDFFHSVVSYAYAAYSAPELEQSFPLIGACWRINAAALAAAPRRQQQQQLEALW